MNRIPISVAMAALCMGIAVLPPVLFDRMVHGTMSARGISFAAVGCMLMLLGLSVSAAHFVRRQPISAPSGARLAISANILFLAFFSLEFSDLIVRRDGKLLYWTNFLFPPSLLLFWGLVTTRRWAWWVSRGMASLGVAWFMGFTLLIPFGDIQRDGVSAPWGARIYMICLSLVFATVLFLAFRAIGHPETRRHFGLAAQRE